MPNTYDIAFTHSHVLLEDGTVAFKCSADHQKWPWLGLEPSHPTVVQSVNYWASVETGITRGTFDPTKWSALTYTRWLTGEPGTGPISHGLADLPGGSDPDDERPVFQITFFDAQGNLVCRLVGKGVVFKTRNFEAWRGDAKKKTAPKPALETFTYAGASALGVSSDVERFLSPLLVDASPRSEALITKENGLLPHHPYHGGSGDHVNANHLADAGLQFAHLVLRCGPLRCTGGEITFKDYVELGRPFTITQTGIDKDSSGAVSMHVQQAGRDCTDMTLSVESVR